MISTNPELPVNLLFWFRLFWLNNPVQISQLKTFLSIPKICKRKERKEKILTFRSSMIGQVSTSFSLIVD